MKRSPFWIIALMIAAVAAGLTLWLSDKGAGEDPGGADRSDQPSARRPHGRGAGWGGGRSGRTSRGVSPSDATPPAAPVHPRVAALAPGIAQILRDLECKDLIVGRHASDDWTDQSITVCGDQQSIDYERLISVNPTHVLLQWGERDLPERLKALAKEHGWLLRSYPLLNLDDVVHSSIAIAGTVVTDELEALRAEDAAAAGLTPSGERKPSSEHAVYGAAVRLSRRLEAAFANDPRLAGAGRVLLLYQGAGEETGGPTRPAALGPGSYSHDLLLRIGGRSATPQGKAFMPMDTEDFATLSPPADAIIIVRPRKASTPAPAAPPTPDELLRSLGAVAKLDIPAVKNKRVALIDDTMALIPGTNLSEFAGRLREILKGWTPEAPAAH